MIVPQQHHARPPLTTTRQMLQMCPMCCKCALVLQMPGVRASICMCTPCLSTKSLRKGSKDVQYLGHRIVKKGIFTDRISDLKERGKFLTLTNLYLGSYLWKIKVTLMDPNECHQHFSFFPLLSFFLIDVSFKIFMKFLCIGKYE